MFDNESRFNDCKKLYGIKKAILYFVDTENLSNYLDKTNNGSNLDKKFSYLLDQRDVIDFNQHFLELSSFPGEEMPRSLVFLILIIALIMIACAVISISGAFHFFEKKWIFFAFLIFSAFVFFVVYVIWLGIIKGSLFTALRTRYRFNRTKRKVYVLRPKEYGGNVILDWDTVKANTSWTPPNSYASEEALGNPKARAERAERGRQEQNLLLYWPPLDENDPERKGEDVLWVGSKGAGERLWNYICTYMEKGMDAVPFPGPDAWLRKGFSGASEHLEENVMHRSHQIDAAVGQGTSTGTYINYALNMPWSPLNSLAERLCYWPTFPEEWNSDCGQKRRESGIGPEEPLRWEAKL